MDVVFENISALIVFTILFLVVYAALLNIYFIYRNGFHVSVNCWFCNKNSKVLYEKRNSFECSHCSQYNGFDKNGDYNKVIQAQHNISLNNSNLIYNEKTGHSAPKPSNGLCDSCNKNQQLRVLQLANYEALNKKNYEMEIEHFERQLEKTYKLCKTCSKVVKSTIRKQNAWIFGNRLKNLKSSTKKGLFPFKANKVSQGSKEDRKFYRKFSVVRFILLALSVFNLVVLGGFDSFIPKYLLPEVSLPSNVIFSNVYSNIYNVSMTKLGHLSFVRHLPKTINVQESSILPICLIGFAIDLLFTLIEKNCSFFVKFGKLLSWIILALVSAVHFKYDISVYICTLQIFCSFWLVYSYGSTCITFQGNQPKKFTLKRLRNTYKNKDYSDNEESSSESLNDSGATYRTAVTNRSPITASSLNNSLNRSFESIRSTKTAPLLNSTFTQNNKYTARNVELNKHFNELNLGAFEANRPTSSQSYRSPASPNPFLNQTGRSQSSNIMYNNYGMSYNPGSSFVQAPQNMLFKLQNLPINSSFGNVANTSFLENQSTAFLNQTRSISPRSDRFERMSVQSQPYSLAANSNNMAFNGQNQQATSFVLQNNQNYNTLSPSGDNNSVRSYNTTMTQRSPTHSLKTPSSSTFLHNSPQTQLNNSFQPLSPVNTMERPNGTLLSAGKLNPIKSFYSDAKENENLSLSFHAVNAPSSFWSNMNNPHLSQRFVVNSVADMQCNSPQNGTVVSGNAKKNMFSNSRSSSSSSGFISNGDLAKVQTRSLPNSRDHSPDRNSLLSEPAYHFKMD